MIYIVANANCVSGGPELLHQFCYHLNKIGKDAKMAYYEKFSFPTMKTGAHLSETYNRYNCQKVDKIIDSKENTIVLSEGELWFLPRFKNAKVVIWWLSVDNYYKSMETKYAKLYAPLGMKRKKYNPFDNKYIHCVQSEYARLFLFNKGIKKDNIYSLSDYLSSEFISGTVNESSKPKKNIVLYNPKKGIDFTKMIINNAKGIDFLPLENMTHKEMMDVMTSSKVYIDFGNHPGKDRIPREAAVCGCCVITNKEGSAGNDKDVPIPNEFKYDMFGKNIPKIIDRITDCLNNYELNRTLFDEYRDSIRRQEDIFVGEVCKIASVL